MPSQNGALRLEERLKAQDDLYASMFRGERKGLLLAAAAIAVAAHAAAAFVTLPAVTLRLERPARATPPAVAHAIVPAVPVVRDRVRARPTAPPREAPRPTSEPPVPLSEPVPQPEPEMEPGSLPPEAEVLLGSPEQPPSGGEAAAEVANPTLIPESKVQPVYPDRARRLRVRGNAILRIDVRPDGRVDAVTALRCTPPNLGFCEAAIDAVKQWRYRPALQHGAPARVSVTVRVSFEAP